MKEVIAEYYALSGVLRAMNFYNINELDVKEELNKKLKEIEVIHCGIDHINDVLDKQFPFSEEIEEEI